MLSIGILANNIPKQVDLHNLPLGNTFAHKLVGSELFLELTKLEVPNIEPWMGWMQLATAYAVWFEERRPPPLMGRRVPDGPEQMGGGLGG